MSFWELVLNSRLIANLIWAGLIITIILLFKKALQERISGITEIKVRGLSVKMRDRVEEIAKRPLRELKQGIIPPSILIGFGELTTIMAHDILYGDIRGLIVDFTVAVRITRQLDLLQDSRDFENLLDELHKVREITEEMKDRMLSKVDNIILSIQDNLTRRLMEPNK
jgi:hypothetical protein